MIEQHIFDEVVKQVNDLESENERLKDKIRVLEEENKGLMLEKEFFE